MVLGTSQLEFIPWRMLVFVMLSHRASLQVHSFSQAPVYQKLLNVASFYRSSPFAMDPENVTGPLPSPGEDGAPDTLPPVTAESLETIEFLSGLMGRSVLFVWQGFQSAMSWRAWTVHRVLGWILPPRLRSVLMIVWFGNQIMGMPGMQRMLRVMLLARQGALPWQRGIFEMFWGGTAMLAWCSTVYATWKYTPGLGFSTPRVVVGMVYRSSTHVVPAAIALWALTRRYPGLVMKGVEKGFAALSNLFPRLIRSPAFGILVYLTHVSDGFLIHGMRKWQRRNVQPVRENQAADLPSREAYQYDPVPEGYFRLLRVRRPWIMAPFECELVPFELEAGLPDYTAVSYAWGQDPSRPCAIGVDGKRLQVTESAYEVVQTLAPAKDETYIWVDFICINQEDVIERASQVKRMGSIYSKAMQVKILLNTVTPVDCDDSDLAAHHLSTMNAGLEKGISEVVEKVRYLHHQKDRKISPGWGALGRLFKREYWNRAWVVQEIAMAKKIVVVYGDNELEWDRLSRFAGAFQNPDNGSALDVLGVIFDGGSIPLAHVLKVNTISVLRQLYEDGGLSLREMFFYGNQFNASDPRDNIFAFLGLAGVPIPYQIEPNYQKSPLELFLNTAEVFLSSDQPLWFLKFAGRGFGDRSIKSRFCSLADSDLPSWVPSWSSQLRKAQLSSLRFLQHSPDHLPKIRVPEKSHTLEVHAAPFDTIVHTVPHPMIHDPGPEGALELASHHLKNVMHMGKGFKTFLQAFEEFVPETYPVKGLKREEISWRVFLGETTSHPDEIAHNNRYWSIQQAQAALADEVIPQVDDLPMSEGTSTTNPRLPQIKQTLHERILAGVNRAASEGRIGDLEKRVEELGGVDMFLTKTNFVFAIGKHSAGRKVGFTKMGHVVLVPPGTRDGDRIFYIAYGETPFVLRAVGEGGDECRHEENNEKEEDGKAKEDGEVFELLGECYVNGVEWADVLGDDETTLRPIALV